MNEGPAITWHTGCTGILWQDISDLFLSVEWPLRDPEKIRAAFEKSTHVVFVKEGGRVIAVGRTVDDGNFYGLIVDVAVHPEKQGLKLGSQIVDHLKSQMQGYSFVTLTAAPGKDGFYEKLGWKRQKSAFIWPKDDKQELLHCF